MEPPFHWGKDPDALNSWRIEYEKQSQEACDAVSVFALEFKPELYPVGYLYHHTHPSLIPQWSPKPSQQYLHYVLYDEPLRAVYYDVLKQIQVRDIVKQYS